MSERLNAPRLKGRNNNTRSMLKRRYFASLTVTFIVILGIIPNSNFHPVPAADSCSRRIVAIASSLDLMMFKTTGLAMCRLPLWINSYLKM